MKLRDPSRHEDPPPIYGITPPLPPNIGRQAGRPPKVRRREPDEAVQKSRKRTKGRPTNANVLLRRQGILNCSRCHQPGHNKRGCKDVHIEPATGQTSQRRRRRPKRKISGVTQGEQVSQSEVVEVSQVEQAVAEIEQVRQSERVEVSQGEQVVKRKRGRPKKKNYVMAEGGEQAFSTERVEIRQSDQNVAVNEQVQPDITNFLGDYNSQFQEYLQSHMDQVQEGGILEEQEGNQTQDEVIQNQDEGEAVHHQDNLRNQDEGGNISELWDFSSQVTDDMASNELNMKNKHVASSSTYRKPPIMDEQYRGTVIHEETRDLLLKDGKRFVTMKNLRSFVRGNKK